jgi:LysR family transcriptional regulator, transcriptional activator of nhaA
MEWINYHHLLYFWVVAREGSVVQAGKRLLLAQPTLSGQIRALENSLGEKLFQKAGRNLVLTDVGRVVYRYADEIFTLGREMTDALKGRSPGRPIRFLVGVADVVPKLVAYRLLLPALALAEPLRLVCLEGKPERLLAELAVHELDLVLTDTPISGLARVRAFSHLLGTSTISVFGLPKMAEHYRKRFPQSLANAPFLLPTENTATRRALEQWFDASGIRPSVVAEFEDSALMKVFGQTGRGLFVAPSIIEKEVERQYGVKKVGRLSSVEERFYAISVERRLKHPAVVAISESARTKLFK